MKRISILLMTILYISGYIAIFYLLDNNTEESTLEAIIGLLEYVLLISLLITVETIPQTRRETSGKVLVLVVILGFFIPILSSIDNMGNIVTIILIIWGIYINIMVYLYSKSNVVYGKDENELLIDKVSNSELCNDQDFINKVEKLNFCTFIIFVLIIAVTITPDIFRNEDMRNILIGVQLLVPIVATIVIYYRNSIFNEIREIKRSENIIDMLCTAVGFLFVAYKYTFVYPEDGTIVNFIDIIIFALIIYTPYKKGYIASKLYKLTHK